MVYNGVQWCTFFYFLVLGTQFFGKRSINNYEKDESKQLLHRNSIIRGKNTRSPTFENRKFRWAVRFF